MQHFGRNFSLLSLPVVIFYTCYAMQSRGVLLTISHEWLFFFWPSFLRALSGMCMGCISYELCQLLRLKFEGRLTPVGHMLFTILGLGIPAFFTLWIILLFTGTSTLVAYPLFASSVVILFSDLGYTSQWFGETTLGAVCRWLGRISLPCYLGQGIVQNYFPESLVGGLKGLLIYCLVCLGMGLALRVLSLALVWLWRWLCVLVRKICLLEA